MSIKLCHNRRKEYIANQLKHDKESDQLSVFDPNALSRVASNQCVAGRPILRRTCAQPVAIRAMPETEIPRAMRVDIYCSTTKAHILFSAPDEYYANYNRF